MSKGSSLGNLGNLGMPPQGFGSMPKARGERPSIPNRRPASRPASVAAEAPAVAGAGEARARPEPLTIPQKKWVKMGRDCVQNYHVGGDGVFNTEQECMDSKYMTPKKKTGGGRKRKPNPGFLAAAAKWRAHLAEYRNDHPGQSLKQQMKGAKKTYKKSDSAVSTAMSKRHPARTKRRKKTKKRKTNKRKSKRSGWF